MRIRESLSVDMGHYFLAQVTPPYTLYQATLKKQHLLPIITQQCSELQILWVGWKNKTWFWKNYVSFSLLKLLLLVKYRYWVKAWNLECAGFFCVLSWKNLSVIFFLVPQLCIWKCVTANHTIMWYYWCELRLRSGDY